MDTIKNLIPPVKRWSATQGKQFTGPKWARFRLFVQYYQGNAKYHSFDYTYKHNYGVKFKVKSELTGLTKLMELMHKKTKGKMYRYANIFCTVGSDMNTITGNFDYLICTIVSGRITWKDPYYWKQGEQNNMLDIAKMKAYQKEKANPVLAESRRLAVQTSLENILIQEK